MPIENSVDFAQPGVRKTPGVHGKISTGTWMAVEFSCITIF